MTPIALWKWRDHTPEKRAWTGRRGRFRWCKEDWSRVLKTSSGDVNVVEAMPPVLQKDGLGLAPKSWMKGRTRQLANVP